MSRSAGTLVTTHNATYIPPRFMPGICILASDVQSAKAGGHDNVTYEHIKYGGTAISYRGHCPTTKYDYGETYGNATAKHFQDYRNEVLNKSSDPYARGGDFPTFYTHKPESVLSSRSRKLDRWLAAPKHSLSNVDFDRKEEIYSFNRLSQRHREFYQDKSGTVKRVDQFLLPMSAEQQIKRNVTFMILSTRHTDDIQLPRLDHEARRMPLIRSFSDVSSQRDREMRDVVFEKR